MNNVNVYLKESLPKVFSKGLSIAPDIPEKKLNNAVSTFGFDVGVNMIVALFDSTLMGSGKDGILFSGERVIYREVFQDPITMMYADIDKVAVDMRGKDSDKPVVVVSMKDGSKVDINESIRVNADKFSEVLNHVVQNMEHGEENQLLTLAQLSEELKTAYLQVVINFTYSDDGVVDDKEFAEILMLMTRMELRAETRFSLRSYIMKDENTALIDLAKLIGVIDKECPASEHKAVHISLVKDLISVYKSTKNGEVATFVFLQDHRELFDVSDDEIELAEMAIDNDRKMLSGDYDDDAVVKSLKELSSKAAAVGVPLGAVYLSGSVVGMSAAGLTSGLATMGFGGALGLSSMATGIGVAVLLGVGAYKGMQHFTGANELDKSKRRAMMLTEVMKQTQLTISLLMSDINFIVEKLNGAIGQADGQKENIQKIGLMLNQYVKACKSLTEQNVELQCGQARLRCPKVLDLDKLTSLTKEPTKQEAGDMIASRYVEMTVILKTDDGDVEKQQLQLMLGLSVAELDEIADAFQAIGYFDMSSVVSGAVSQGADKAKEKLKGLFA
tara:strand:+ start:632 stop:2305 length:1674 start_codon:yes stop_codon:yes gene_type:complete